MVTRRIRLGSPKNTLAETWNNAHKEAMKNNKDYRASYEAACKGPYKLAKIKKGAM